MGAKQRGEKYIHTAQRTSFLHRCLTDHHEILTNYGLPKKNKFFANWDRVTFNIDRGLVQIVMVSEQNSKQKDTHRSPPILCWHYVYARIKQS